MSHALRVGVADQIGYFRAYNTDGSAKTDLTSSTTGLALSVFRVGASAVSISSLSAKAADNTAHADGAIRAVSGNLYTVDLPDAACEDQVSSISVKGSYTGGVIEGPEHPLIGYNPATTAVGAMTTLGANAPGDWINAAAIAASALNGKGDWLLSSGYTAPSNATIASIYAIVQLIDADVSTMPTDVRDAILNRVLAGNHTTSGTVGLLLQFLDALISSRLAPTTPGRTLAVDAAGAVALDSAVGTQITNIENASGYLLAVLAGECADPQTASETYAITVFGSTFTVDMAGQTSTGIRTAPTLTKA